jgi:hypothetical protein
VGEVQGRRLGLPRAFKVDVGQAVPGKTANDASGIYSFTAPVALLDQKFNRAVAA